jgi:tetratricopeptide (TPR) repeat protein
MVAAQLKADPSLPRDGYSLYSMAWEIVDPAARKFGDEVQALALARMALDDGRVREWACRDTLARAFLVLGRFDESLAEQQRALDAAPPADMAAYQERLQALRDDIMQWRDPQGRLKDEDIYQAIASLEAEIERLASDTEVQLWLHFLPGKADGTGRGSRP